MAGKSRSLGSLLVNVGADTRALDSGLKSATENVKQFGNKTASTARKAEGSFQKIGRGGASIADSFSGLSQVIPSLGGMLGIGAIGSVAFGSLQKAVNEISAFSPEVQLIQARREEFGMFRAMEKGKKAPVVGELLSGGAFSTVQAGFMEAGSAPLQQASEGNFLKSLLSITGPGILFNLMRGGIEEQRFATDSEGIFDVDRKQLETNRLNLTGQGDLEFRRGN